MKHGITILGSTGSIGRQSLDVAEKMGIRVTALAAGRSIEPLEKQIRKFKPDMAAVYDERAAGELKLRVADTATKIVPGIEGLCLAAAAPEADTVVTAVVGTVGLIPTMTAICEKKRIALANKETLVCAGDMVMRAARECGAEILPVDSEHSAIFQCLEGNRQSSIKRILLTASGGPFRGMTAEQMRSVTKEQALAHPNWNMGAKITIDSATMMNKGLEFIEAMHLFGVGPEQIKILVHPQSIVHSMVEFSDNSVIAQMGAPDMRLPIQLALTYPLRCGAVAKELDLTEAGPLTFEEPDLDAFRCLRLAMETAKRGGAACAVMNAANEAAVELFLRDKIGFSQIYEFVSEAVEKIGGCSANSIEDILIADRQARLYINRKV